MARSRNTADTQTASGGPVSPSIAGKNAVINGGFDVWQRGTSITGASKRYTADRWSIYAGSGGSQSSSYTITRQSTSDTTNLPFIQYCARFQRNSGSTSAQLFNFVQSFETVNSIPLAGRTVTISFYARRGDNYSPTSNLLNIQVTSDTGTDQYLTDYSVYNDAINQSATLTTTWQRFSYSGTFATNANEIAVGFNATPTGTAGANDYFEVTGVQLELGSVATPFSRAGGTIQGELAACQRYFQEIGMIHPAKAGASTYIFTTIQFNPMRVTPTIDLTGAYAITDPGLSSKTQSAKNILNEGSGSSRGGMLISMANFTALTTGTIYYSNSGSIFIQLSAEL
jgi:hypothetical protein